MQPHNVRSGPEVSLSGRSVLQLLHGNATPSSTSTSYMEVMLTASVVVAACESCRLGLMYVPLHTITISHMCHTHPTSWRWVSWVPQPPAKTANVVDVVDVVEADASPTPDVKGQHRQAVRSIANNLPCRRKRNREGTVKNIQESIAGSIADHFLRNFKASAGTGYNNCRKKCS